MNVSPILSRPFRPLVLLSLLAALIVLDGCSFLKPSTAQTHYYLLSAGPSLDQSKHRGRAYTVRILPVELPDYLQTRDMVVRTGTNEIYFTKFNLWAEPLENGIRRVLAENLQHARGAQVLTDQSFTAGNVDAISIRVLSCEAKEMNGQDVVAFSAVWEISATGHPERPSTNGLFQSPPLAWHPGDYAGLASQISSAVADLSRVLDQAITRHSNDKSVP